MAARKASEFPSLRPRSKLTSELQLHLCGSVFTIDKELLAQKSSRVARLLQKNPHADLSLLLRGIPADQDSMEIVARFCHGFEINLSVENVVRVACVADYLGMTGTHCSNNLLDKALVFFEHQIVPSWINSIKALKSTEHVFDQARDLGLIDYCAESIIKMALEDPRLLGEPIRNLNWSSDDEDEDEEEYRPNARRKLFDVDWRPEDLTALSLRLYGPITYTMMERGVRREYVAANIIQYAKIWIFSCEMLGEEMSMNYQREIVETLVGVMPDERCLFPCTFLCEMLQFAIALNASTECKNELEIRIGKQLEHASVKDLLIPSQGYARDEKYDTDCLVRIVKNFCNNGDQEIRALNSVAELIDEFLAEIAGDIDLKTMTFAAVADLAVALSHGIRRSSDGIYRAIDIYLDKHRYLTETEKENLCKFLDCNRLSAEACEHAARSEKLPVRVVVQVLFVSQLKIREAIPKGMVVKAEEEEGVMIGCKEDVRTEMEKMGSKVSELERKCNVMRREIERGEKEKEKRKKGSVWRDMKRKFGCVTSMHDCDCHVKKKKVHPRYN